MQSIINNRDFRLISTKLTHFSMYLNDINILIKNAQFGETGFLAEGRTLTGISKSLLFSV